MNLERGEHNLAIWSPLTTHWSVTSDSSPRGDRIQSIGHHHAASTSLASVLAAMQPGGREVSSNYVIYRDQIWGVVPEDRRAWTSGSAIDDNRAITYEIINSSAGPSWTFDPVTIDTVMRLDADISRRYGIPLQHGLPGFWEHRNLWEWFRRSYPTACAGPSFNINQIILGTAKKLAPSPAPPKPKIKKEAEMLGMYVGDGEGRLGPVGGKYWATFDGANKTITYLTNSDANAVSSNMGTPFASLTYKAWGAYHLQADTFIDATVDPPVKLSGPKGTR